MMIFFSSPRSQDSSSFGNVIGLVPNSWLDLQFFNPRFSLHLISRLIRIFFLYSCTGTRRGKGCADSRRQALDFRRGVHLLQEQILSENGQCEFSTQIYISLSPFIICNEIIYLIPLLSLLQISYELQPLMVIYVCDFDCTCRKLKLQWKLMPMPLSPMTGFRYVIA